MKKDHPAIVVYDPMCYLWKSRDFFISTFSLLLNQKFCSHAKVKRKCITFQLTLERIHKTIYESWEPNFHQNSWELSLFLDSLYSFEYKCIRSINLWSIFLLSSIVFKWQWYKTWQISKCILKLRNKVYFKSDLKTDSTLHLYRYHKKEKKRLYCSHSLSFMWSIP